MKMKLLTLSCSCMCLLLAACTGGEPKPSEKLYLSAVQCADSGNFNAAKLKLDSLHTLYRGEIDMRRRADTLLWNIELKESTRNLAYCDSMLALSEPELEKMRRRFVATADSALLGYNVYMHRSQGKSYLPHTNLLSEVRDDGELNMVSVFMGRELNHISYKVSAAGVYKESLEVPLSSPANNRFDDLGIRWEYVTYRPDKQNGTAEFVAAYYKQKVMVTLNSANSLYKFYLDERDKNAIKESVEFASLLKSVLKMRDDRQRAEDKIAWINETLNPSAVQ